MVPLSIALLLLLGAGGVARAHSHAPAVQDEAAGPAVTVAFEPEVATFRDEHGAGNFQGMGLRLSGGSRAFSAAVRFPVYRLQSEGATWFGPGDPSLAVAVPVFGRAGAGPAGGFALMGSAPLGDAGRQLGMGHAMLMAGIWTSVGWSHLALAAEVGYGRALAALDGHAGHHGPAAGPVVNPMNPSEVTAGLSGTLQRVGPLRWLAAATGAVPVLSAGRARAILGLGADATIARWTVGARAEATVAGAPSLLRLLLSTGYAFR